MPGVGLQATRGIDPRNYGVKSTEYRPFEKSEPAGRQPLKKKIASSPRVLELAGGTPLKKKVAGLSPAGGAVARVTSDILSPAVILTSMHGYLDVELAKRSAARFAELIVHTSEPSWAVDILGLTGFDPSAVIVGNRWWTTFKQNGGREVVLIARSAAYRMTAATLGFGSGLKVKTFETLHEALTYMGVGLPERHAK